MKHSYQSTLAAAAKGIFKLLVVCVPVLVLFNLAQGQHSAPASDGAKGMPGALGTFEFKPSDWKPNETTYWKDTDGVDPGVAGCHIGVTQDGKPNGRFFGEACEKDNKVLIESNPGAQAVHAHKNDIGHPDRFDCNAWCVGARKAKSGMCVPVTTGVAPCAASARCECK